jgi:hypothetical protein
MTEEQNKIIEGLFEKEGNEHKWVSAELLLLTLAKQSHNMHAHISEREDAKSRLLTLVPTLLAYSNGSDAETLEACQAYFRQHISKLKENHVTYSTKGA